MTKQEVLLEIKEFREAFNKIKPEQFYFGLFVSEVDLEHNCGTVCCLWGWIPQIAPDIAERYKLYYDLHFITSLSTTPDILHWPTDIKNYLFYPGKVLFGFMPLSHKISLPDMLEVWDKVITTLETTERLDYLF